MGKRKAEFMFTPENLLANIEKLGAWSSYGLASVALQHYFPEEYDKDGYCETVKECQLLGKLGCEYWHEAIIKYQNEVGYLGPFNSDCVNER